MISDTPGTDMLNSMMVPHGTMEPAVVVHNGGNAEFVRLTPKLGRPALGAMPGGQGGARHADGSVVAKLLRICEELLERDDLPDVDVRWYRRRLVEIKEELGAEACDEAQGLGCAAGIPEGIPKEEGPRYPAYRDLL